MRIALTDFAIGRLPARTAQDAELMFNKIVSRGTPSGAWANTVLSIADRPEGYDFAAAANAATSFVPHAMTLQKIEFAQSTAGRTPNGDPHGPSRPQRRKSHPTT